MVRTDALPLAGAADLDPLVERIADARYVLIGEASHGTHEYYAWRAALTRRLVEEQRFGLVAVEGDWPDCYELSRSVTLAEDAAGEPADVLAGFDRWPTWMWANEEVVEFAGWLRGHNSALPAQERVGFYGLDVYSLWDSLRAVRDYLVEHRPEQVKAAREAFRCFEPFGEDPQSYARAAALVPADCEAEVVELLRELRGVAHTGQDGSRAARFSAEQNARAAAGAEAYYRSTVGGGPQSWNIRDRHMVETLEQLMAYHGEGAKAVVWAHNTHVGDARWTDMAGAGMVNVGQLVREAHGEDDVVIVGFGCHSGDVIASDQRGGETMSIPMPPARAGSVEDLLHDWLGEDSRSLFLLGEDLPGWAADRRDHRAVGVVYQPVRELWGNYVPTVLGRRYDAFLWFDRTTSLAPLHGEDGGGASAETWPSGL
jgi:erythromycin esterase-like protein